MAEKKNAGKEIRKPQVRSRGASPEKQMQRIEKEIARIEAQLAALEEECSRYATDYQKLMELEEQKEALNAELMEQYERWEALSDEA